MFAEGSRYLRPLFAIGKLQVDHAKRRMMPPHQGNRLGNRARDPAYLEPGVLERLLQIIGNDQVVLNN